MPKGGSVNALASLTQAALEIAKPEQFDAGNFLVRLNAYMAATGIRPRRITVGKLVLLVDDCETWRLAARARRSA
jgi:hypothetical protein